MTTLTKLGFGCHENRFLARIISVWESFSIGAYYTPMLNFTLVDTEEEQYWAIAPFSERERLLSTVFPGMLYHISDFRIVPAQGPLRPLKTTIILVFGRNTQWDDYVYRSSIPRFKFTLSSWPIILTRIDKETLLTDVAGVLICVEDIKVATNGIQRLNLTLIDKSLIPIHVSLWDIKARTFQRDFKEHSQKNVVTIITGLLVKLRKGTVYLSSTPGTTTFFNPKFDPIVNLPKCISHAYGDFICCQPQQIEPRYQILAQENIMTPYLTLQQLLRIRLWLYQKFRCNVTITDILLRGCRHDGSCLYCKGSVITTQSKYYCAACGRNFVTPSTRPSIVLHVKDHTGNTKFNIQPPELGQLTGFSRKDLLKDRKLVNGIWTFPKALEIINNAKCTFEVMLTPSSFSKTTGKLIVDGIVKYTKMKSECPA